MNVYGWDDTGPARGELLGARVDADALDFGPEMLARELGWERAFRSFREARQALLAEMKAQGADRELIRAVRAMQAHYVPKEEVA